MKVAGRTRGLGHLFRSHGLVRVTISGYDPLAIPRQARPLPGAKTIRLEHSFDIRHGWRSRRRRNQRN